MTRVWIDIDNPPQVQYLGPLVRSFEDLGCGTVVTARDYGVTIDLLRGAGVDARVVGGMFGKSRMRKGLGLIWRALRLLPIVGRHRPALLLSSSRSSAIVARLLRLPSFIFCDYEHVELGLYRRLGSTILFPDAINPDVFRSKGFDSRTLMPFSGLKEDISFSAIDFTATPAYSAPVDERLVKVLFRPPASESHYYSSASGRLADEILNHLSQRDDAVVIFSPRYPRQADQLLKREWTVPPLVLDRPIPFASLLKGVDLVISSGGTMLREAAYIGLPAYSIFKSEIGAVDRHLESTGRLALLESSEDFRKIRFEKRGELATPRGGQEPVNELARRLLARIDHGA